MTDPARDALAAALHPIVRRYMTGASGGGGPIDGYYSVAEAWAAAILAALAARGVYLVTEETLAAAREELAALEHEQWAAWAMTLMATEPISAERRGRWQPLINAGYEDLSEEMKDHDRKWADRSIAAVLRLLDGPPPDHMDAEQLAEAMDWFGHRPHSPEAIKRASRMIGAERNSEMAINKIEEVT